MLLETFKRLSRAQERAELKHPGFPDALDSQCTILAEEKAELDVEKGCLDAAFMRTMQAANDVRDEGRAVEEFYAELEDLMSVGLRMMDKRERERQRQSAA